MYSMNGKEVSKNLEDFVWIVWPIQ